MKIIFFILFSLLVLSCDSDYGNKVVGDKFTVYFTDVKDQKLAEEIAVYFKENELITSQKQDLQLVRLKKKLQLRMIANQSKDIVNMSFDERKLLTELQTSLYQEVIKSPFELVICNDKFEPIFNLNE
ncbi:MAG: hypothetical protein QNL61_01000 [Crocinitomicaceae bacterium]